jgi:hypothetical protein
MPAKMYKSPGVNQIPAEFIKAGDKNITFCEPQTY